MKQSEAPELLISGHVAVKLTCQHQWRCVVVVYVVMVMVFPVDSELLQALDLCDNDPVAVARCFVMRVRRKIQRDETEDSNVKSADHLVFNL